MTRTFLSRLIAIVLAFISCASLFGAETFLQLPTDATNTGKKLRMRSNVIGADTVYSQGMFIDDGSGSGALGLVGSPLFVTFTNAAIAATQSGTWTFVISQTGTNNDVDVVTMPAITGTVGINQPGTANDVDATIAGTGATAETNTATADYDTGGGTVTQRMVGVALPASGGPVAGGTSTNPLRVDVTGTTAQPITDNGGSLTVDGSVTVTQASGANLNVNVDSAPSTAVTGTVTANAGTNLNTSALALDATLTGGTQKTKIVDTGGTNVATVSAAGAVKVDASATTQPISGSVTVTQGTGTNLHVVVDTAPSTAVTGTVTANAGTNLNTSALALDATLTGGTQKAIVRSATKGTSTAADVTSENVDGNTQALHVFIKNASVAVTGTFFQATQPVSIAATIGTNLAQVNGATVPTGNGTASGAQRVSVASDNTTIPVTAAQGAAAATTAGWPTTSGTVNAVTAAWTSATTVDTTLPITVTGYNVVSVTIVPSGSVTSGTIFFETSDDGTTWFGQYGAQQNSLLAALSISVTVKASFIVPVAPFAQFRVRLNPIVGGTGTATIRIQASNGAREGWPELGSIAGSVNAVDSVLETAVGLNNAAMPTRVQNNGIEAQSGQPTAATTGNIRQVIGTLDGALFVREGGPVSWTCGLNALAATLTQCQAAPSAGLSLYITDIVVQTSTATSGTYAIQMGTGSNCVTGTAALFPVSGTANRWGAPIVSTSPTVHNFKIPLKATAASAICVIGVATNTINIQINGFTAP